MSDLKKLLIIAVIFININKAFSQSICLPSNQSNSQIEEWSPNNSRSVSDLKIVRVNFHQMLRTNGTGNFTETDDGLGNLNYTGYDYTRRLVEMCNWVNFNNELANIPLTNKPAVNDKNIRWIIDAIYFWRNDNSYISIDNINYAQNGRDGANVLNIFLSGDGGTYSGWANDVSSTGNQKHTSNTGYWGNYRTLINGGGVVTDQWWGAALLHLNHELFHLLTLHHTVRYNNNQPCFSSCPSGCSNICPTGPINNGCDDFCGDTPSAWEITQANGCTRHPNCSFGEGNVQWCSNNVMDYTGGNSMTPCQINRIHSALEGGLRPYLACNAVATNLSLCDIGYPKLSYFGKDVSIGCVSTPASLTTREKVDVYTSNFVELTNFEVATDAAFEIFHLPVCGF